MTISPIAFFGLLDENNPIGNDSRTIADDQFRNVLASCKQQAPNWTGPVTSTHGDVNLLAGYVVDSIKPMPGEGGVTVLFAYNADTPPAGWTIEEPDTNLRELIIGPAVSGGTIGGSINPINLTDSVSVGISGNTGSSSVAHTHDAGSLSLGPSTVNVDRDSNGFSSTADNTHSHDVSGNTGGASSTSHSHSDGSLSGSGSVSISPRYARGILMKLNA